MAFSEVYQALQTGVVDGTENPPSNMFTQKHYEVQKFATLSDHGYLGYVVIANKKFWEGLPTDLRGQLETAMKDATVYANEISQQENDDAMREMRKSGKTTFIELTPEQKATWHRIFSSRSIPEMASRVGKEIIEEFQKETRGASQ